MAGDVVAGDVEKEKVVQAGEEVGGEEGEGVVLDEELLQVGALLEDGLLEDGLLELKICRQSALQGERVAGIESCRESELFWWSHFCRLELCWEMVGGQGEWGPLEGPLVRHMPSACCLLFL